MDYAKPALADALAQQYAAGTLRGAARRRYEALLPGHPLLRDVLAQWQARLMPLTVVVAPQAPPARVWRRIEQRLWAATASAPLRWWQRLSLWRGSRRWPAWQRSGWRCCWCCPARRSRRWWWCCKARAARRRASTASSPASAATAARWSRDRCLPVSIEANRVLELWSVPPDGAPRSLGVIAADGATFVDRRRLPASLLKGGTAALAVMSSRRAVHPPAYRPAR
jgi:hypothetical protein